MKCKECNGRGHHLFAMSNPTCDACGGSGEATCMHAEAEESGAKSFHEAVDTALARAGVPTSDFQALKAAAEAQARESIAYTQEKIDRAREDGWTLIADVDFTDGGATDGKVMQAGQEMRLSDVPPDLRCRLHSASTIAEMEDRLFGSIPPRTFISQPEIPEGVNAVAELAGMKVTKYNHETGIATMVATKPLVKTTLSLQGPDPSGDPRRPEFWWAKINERARNASSTAMRVGDLTVAFIPREQRIDVAGDGMKASVWIGHVRAGQKLAAFYRMVTDGDD